MPYINVQIAGALTVDQKKKIAQAITMTIEEIANKPAQYTYIVFEEVEHEDWAVGGKLLSDNSD